MSRRRAVLISTVLIGLVAASRPVAAQNQQTSFRPFFLFSAERFAAEQTFTAGFGHAVQPLFGGGVSVAFPNHMFVDVSISRFGKTGERGFAFNGQSFGLGIPLKTTIVPIEGAVGYRFVRRTRLRVSPVTPYLGAGIGTYRYTESDDAGGGGEFSAQHVGYLALGGVEVRVGKWVALSGDVQYTRVTGILGSGGVSQLAGEDDLGGVAGRARVLIGR